MMAFQETIKKLSEQTAEYHILLLLLLYFKSKLCELTGGSKRNPAQMTVKISPDESTSQPYVFLREDRSYVQGTQMISRAAELLPEWTFRQSRFDRITDRKIELSFQKPIETPLGSCVYALGEDRREVFFTPLDEPAARVDEKMPIGIWRENDAQFGFKGVSSFEDVLNVLVQSVKASHQQIGTDLTDVWLSGMRNFFIPQTCHSDLQTGAVATKLQRVLRTASAHQSLWEVKLSNDNNFSSNGTMTFAFKKESGKARSDVPRILQLCNSKCSPDS